MLFYLLEFLRDVAIIAAAGIASLAAWRWLGAAAARDAALARQLEIAELAVKTQQDSAGHLSQLAGDAQVRRVAEQRTAEALRFKVDVHRLLHATSDPYLTFAELESEIAKLSTNAPHGAELRGLLIEMLAAGVIAQLDGDRYFIASEFETSEEAPDTSAR